MCDYFARIWSKSTLFLAVRVLVSVLRRSVAAIEFDVVDDQSAQINAGSLQSGDTLLDFAHRMRTGFDDHHRSSSDLTND